MKVVCKEFPVELDVDELASEFLVAFPIASVVYSSLGVISASKEIRESPQGSCADPPQSSVSVPLALFRSVVDSGHMCDAFHGSHTGLELK